MKYRRRPSCIVDALAAGCATSVPEIERPGARPCRRRPPAAFKEGDGRWTRRPPAEAQPRGEWWKAFSDPVLDDLVERATAATPASRCRRRGWLRRVPWCARRMPSARPQVGVGAGARRAQGIVGGDAGPARNCSARAWTFPTKWICSAAFRTRACRRAGRAGERGLLQSTRLLVQAEGGADLSRLARARCRERARASTVVAYRETLALTERRWRAGDVAELDVARASTEVAVTESDALALDRQRAELEHALAVLVGEVSSTFSLPVGEWTHRAAHDSGGNAGHAAHARPDVSAAQSTMLAAQSRVGVAKSACFPRVTLTGSAGYASTDLSDLFEWSSRAWLLGALALAAALRRRAAQGRRRDRRR